MATGDFAWLKLQLAYMAGRNSVAELDNDQYLAGQCVNEALLDMYMGDPVRGTPRPNWALQTEGFRLRSPVTATVGVTQGSNVMTGYTFPTDMVGSTIQIGQLYYQYAGLQNGLETLTTPFQEATGSYPAQMWHDSYPLAVNVAEFEEAPLVLGWGLLRPFNSRAEKLRWQQITFGDFWGPAPYGAGLLTTINWPGGLSYPTGTPLYYLIDNAPLGGTAGSPQPGGGQSQSGTVNLSNGATSVAVTFPFAFGATPVVVPIINAPDSGGSIISVAIDESSVTTTGFTAIFAGSIPSTGYTMNWIAQGSSSGSSGSGSSFSTIKTMFSVAPMPTQITTISFKAWVLPTELVADADYPVVPGDLVTRVLLPLCREKWAMIYKKYTGTNMDGLVGSANAARAILRRMNTGQRDKPIRAPLRNI